MASFLHFLVSVPVHQVAEAHLIHLKAILYDSSKGRYGRDIAATLRDAARCSAASVMLGKSLELRHTIRLIHELDTEIEDIEAAIQSVMDEIRSPIITIPDMGIRMGAIILVKKAISLSSTRQMKSSRLPEYHLPLTNLGALRYLESIRTWKSEIPTICDTLLTTPQSMSVIGTRALPFTLLRSGNEGKHYNVALSRAAKKLVRLIYAMETSQQPYRNAA